MNSSEIRFGNYYGMKTYTDIYAVDGNDLVFASIVGTDSNLKTYQKAINNGEQCYIDFSPKRLAPKSYETKREKDQTSGLSQLLVYKKMPSKPFEDFNDSHNIYLFANGPKATSPALNELPADLKDKLFEAISFLTSVPVIKEWDEYLLDNLIRHYRVNEITIRKRTKAMKERYDSLSLYRIQLSSSIVKQIVTNGLANGHISVDGTNNVSDSIQEVTGLDSYLNGYSKQLAEKIQSNFTPKFDPHNDKYDQKLNQFEKNAMSRGLNMFPAQKAVVQGTINNMRENDTSIIIGEPSAGKTIMSMASIYGHTNKSKTNNIIMAPSIMVNKWRRELIQYMPNSEVTIIKNLEDFKAAEKFINNPLFNKHFFMIMSADTAKLNYNERPSVIYNNRKDRYICPECGKPTFKMINRDVSYSRRKEKVREYLTHEDFLKQSKSKKPTEADFCANSVKDYKNLDSRGKPKFKKCGAPLWTALAKSEDLKWIKLGSHGWVHEDAFESYKSSLSANEKNLKKNQRNLLKAMYLYENNPNNFRMAAPSKYAISDYIHKYYKNKIDYFVADEIHLYGSGDSYCGKAFGHIVSSSRKTIGLTGTLLNGYASSVYFLLYRCYSRKMQEEGFDFSTCNPFEDEYGVVKRTTGRTIQTHEQVGGVNRKVMPGISPIVFTKFLLSNCAFITMDEMKEGMVSYREIPMPIDMDPNIREEYNQLELDVRSSLGGRRGGGRKILARLMNTLFFYPDMPYGHAPVVHPDDPSQVFLTPNNMNHYKEVRTPKMNRTLDIVREKMANNEKVLIYYTNPGRTDIGDKLNKMFEEEGIRSMELKSDTTSAAKREDRISKEMEKGLDVLICNPSLVEVGLDLLDFTTIIYFQIPYSIFTLRQSSRRSWRLTQTRPVEVYFMYYRDTTQQQALSLIANKLEASMAIEGKFSEEGLQAMSNNDDILMRIATSVANGIKEEVDAKSFEKFSHDAEEGAGSKNKAVKYIMPYDSTPFERSHSRKKLNSGQHALFVSYKDELSTANLRVGAL